MSDAKTPADLSMDEILTTIRRIIAGEEAATRGLSAGLAAPASDAEAVLELTEVLDEGGTAPPPLEPPAPAATGRAPPLMAGPGATPLEPRMPLPGAISPRVEPEPVKSSASPVLAEAASFAASLRGAATLRREPRLDDTPTLDSRKLEDIVGEMLRPLLRSWLDDNLPLLIERLVQAEIARVVRNPGPI
jgi:hypothetical protein